MTLVLKILVPLPEIELKCDFLFTKQCFLIPCLLAIM